ncbi:sensor histidine kinase [Clostridium tetani]|nr:ATP-binding protein [Clostridium tetani]
MDETLIAKINQKMIRLAEILEHESVKGMKGKKELQVLISDISHQVKTPLTNLKMLQCTLLEKELPKEKRIELLLSVGRQLNKLDFLLNSMIKTSRLETGLIQLNKLEENLFETIAEALSGITILAEKKNMNILVKSSEEFLLKHDRKWTAEALFNVLENAVKYSPKGTVIEIQVSRWEISTKIDIIDQGKGIPEEHHGKIFQRFYREEYNNDEEGIGIGLYLTREIIQKQGGYIKVSSTVSKGSTFSIFLPNN